MKQMNDAMRGTIDKNNPAVKARLKAWRDAHRDELRIRGRAQYHKRKNTLAYKAYEDAHREEKKEYKKRYEERQRASNLSLFLTKAAERARRYYNRNNPDFKARFQAWCVQYRIKNRQCIRGNDSKYRANKCSLSTLSVTDTEGRPRIPNKSSEKIFINFQKKS